MYVFKNSKEIRDPFYKKSICPYPWEVELLHSRAVRRLKFLSHYGTGSFVTAVKHSRFEHTLGVWTIISTFFPQDEELRIAALLHDIGHLPFSHAVEKTLGFNHHHITEQYIQGEEISSILTKYGFDPFKIIDLLNKDTALSHKTAYLSADHLDSFVRDSYMLGACKVDPATLLDKITFNHHFVEADLKTCTEIMYSIYQDHLSFLSPTLIALDAMLAKAISLYVQETKTNLQSIQPLTNHELLQLLLSSENEDVKNIMSIILWNPEQVTIHEERVEGAEKIRVNKVYDKTPLVEGVPLTSICSESKRFLDEIRSLQKDYYFTFDYV